eukprot:TRINITY_DN12697_c0_g1_i2.p1 TRINITY_DN12697_c0_g1~~TRINITY_DN12697_c0_g1_i2.p1  ORF type:complete len:180 (-),score=13.66 TRINITY_DN12697_c0_g1_i2:537-1076(-)
MPVQLNGVDIVCRGCGHKIAVVADLFPQNESGIVPVGLSSKPYTMADQRTSLFYASQSFIINPFPRQFQLVLSRKLVFGAGVEAGPDATTEHTWFENHAHRILLCTSCNQHIGWSYRNVTSGNMFYGLAVRQAKHVAVLVLLLMLAFSVYQFHAENGNAMVATVTLSIAIAKISPHLFF